MPRYVLMAILLMTGVALPTYSQDAGIPETEKAPILLDGNAAAQGREPTSPVYVDTARKIVVPGNWSTCKVYRSRTTGRNFTFKGMPISVAGSRCPGNAESPGWFYVSGTLVGDNQLVMPDLGAVCTIGSDGNSCISTRAYQKGKDDVVPTPPPPPSDEPVSGTTVSATALPKAQPGQPAHGAETKPAAHKK